MAVCALLLSMLCWLPAPQEADAHATDDAVHAFIDRADSRLYRAERAGLAGLSFQIPFELPLPMVQPLAQQLGVTLSGDAGEQVYFGEIAVSWSLGTAPRIEFDEATDLQPELVPLVALLEQEYQGRAITALNLALCKNADVHQLLTDFQGELIEDDDGLDQVVFTPRASDFPLPISRLVWFFDQDGVPVKTIMESQQADPSGTITVKRTQTNHWRPASDDTDALVLDWAHTIQDAGPLGTVTSEISFEYGTFDGILLSTGFTETTEAQDMSFVSEVRLANITAQRGS